MAVAIVWSFNKNNGAPEITSDATPLHPRPTWRNFPKSYQFPVSIPLGIYFFLIHRDNSRFGGKVLLSPKFFLIVGAPLILLTYHSILLPTSWEDYPGLYIHPAPRRVAIIIAKRVVRAFNVMSRNEGDGRIHGQQSVLKKWDGGNWKYCFSIPGGMLMLRKRCVCIINT